jgi:ABC-2 type transport system permease protein
MDQATRELTLLQGRELVRDRRYFYFALLFPFWMLAIFLTIGAVVPKSAGAPDFTQTVIPMALFLAVTGTALTVTAGPLAGLRDKGTLRLLGTTPVGRGRFIAAHMVPRVAMVVCQAVVLLLVALATGAVRVSSLPALFGSCLLGLAMFLSFGYLLGGRLRSPDAASNIGTLVQLGSLFLSGLALPLWLMPDTLATVLSWLPTTLFADLMTRQMSDGKPYHSAWAAMLVVSVTAAVFVVLAVRTFRWEQGDSD